MADLHPLFASIVNLHDAIRESVLDQMRRQRPEALSRIERDEEGDTIYHIDTAAERITEASMAEIGRQHSCVLIAEGGSVDADSEADAEWRIIHDPIDGTRGLMYQKRSAWI